MTLLENYEQQYSTLVAEITASIGRLQKCNEQERRDLCCKVDGFLIEAHELLEQIGLEIRELNGAHRQSFSSKVNCYQVELKRLQNEYSKLRNVRNTSSISVHTTDQGSCVYTSDEYFDDVSMRDDQRQHLLDNSERIERTGNRLSEGYRIAIETETLGAQVLSDLQHQRETLQGARARLRETNADLGRASRTLNSMMLRALREKAVLYGVGVFFVIAVIISLYLTFQPSESSN